MQLTARYKLGDLCAVNVWLCGFKTDIIMINSKVHRIFFCEVKMTLVFAL